MNLSSPASLGWAGKASAASIKGTGQDSSTGERAHREEANCSIGAQNASRVASPGSGTCREGPGFWIFTIKQQVLSLSPPCNTSTYPFFLYICCVYLWTSEFLFVCIACIDDLMHSFWQVLYVREHVDLRELHFKLFMTTTSLQGPATPEKSEYVARSKSSRRDQSPVLRVCLGP